MLHSQETDFHPASPLTAAGGSGRWTALINENKFMRECIHRAFALSGNRVASFASVEEFASSDEPRSEDGVVVLCVGHRSIAEAGVSRDVERLASRDDAPPLAILGDLETYEQITGALEAGAKGYIPASTPLDVMVEALDLVRVGGVFLPSAILNGSAGGRTAAREEAKHMFTSRQSAVVKALRQGKANKLIAYELNMCESTVKVHVRNIMRKLNAHNRTEVAYRTNGMFPDLEAK